MCHPGHYVDFKEANVMKGKNFLELLLPMGMLFLISCNSRPAISPLISSLSSPVRTPAPTIPVFTPTPSIDRNAGLTAEQPAPLGITVVAEDGFQITVLEVKRDAEEILVGINPANMFNLDQEAIMVRVRVCLPQAPAAPIILLPYDFDLVDETGALYPYPLTVIVSEQLAANFEQPTTVEGWLAFVLPQGHEKLILRYAPKGRSQTYEPRWLSLNP
jgi:hypothetical protein